MRELGQLCIYVAGAACTFVGIVAGGSVLLGEYRDNVPREAALAATVSQPVEPPSAAASKEPEISSATVQPTAPHRPVWIAPTAKYNYAPPERTTTKREPNREARAPKAAKKVARKPSRQRAHALASRVDREVRQAYGYAAPPRPDYSYRMFDGPRW